MTVVQVSSTRTRGWRAIRTPSARMVRRLGTTRAAKRIAAVQRTMAVSRVFRSGIVKVVRVEDSFSRSVELLTGSH
jgi:hypothetical protein